MGLVVSTTRWKAAFELYFMPKETQRAKLRLRAREAFGRHEAGCVTSFSVTQSRPHAGQSESPPGGGLAWACIELWVLKEALSFKLQEQYARGVPGDFDSH